MSRYIDDAKAATSCPHCPHIKDFLDFMEDYEDAHTQEETGRMWAWVRDYLRADLKKPEQVS